MHMALLPVCCGLIPALVCPSQSYILLYQINHLKQLQQRTGQSQRSGTCTQTMPQHVFCCMLPDYLYEYDTVESMEA